ncbi:MAG: DUF354 domain-containing protein [Chloroflexi bacterium]|nr:DUF354 domain-containing protein [Chloroflexota bacterium]
MKLMILIAHPAHVHQFRYVIENLKKNGHTVKVVAIKKEMNLELLDTFNIHYEVISSKSGSNPFQKAVIFLITTYKIFRISRKFRPDIHIGRAFPMVSLVSFATRSKHIMFSDSEQSFALRVTTLFADVIITPQGFSKDLGRKHIKVDAYKELSYLHPNYFTPDPSVLSELNLSPYNKFVILRFVAWDAYHDFGQHGFSLEEKRKLVGELEKHVRVLITSESQLPEEFEPYRITVGPEKMHDLLYYSHLLVGDSQTMTTEAAMLGKPAVRCNSFVGPNDMGNFIELEHEYDLIYSFQEPEQAIDKALELINHPNLKEEWAKKHQKLLAHKIDLTEFMIDFIENYPASFHKYSERITG